MDYSPVIIPTLCRYEHLRTCIESLQRCTHAEETDLIIGLDYPLKESHWEGYRKIDEYLQTIPGFHQVIVFRRERNWGADANATDLHNYADAHYDSFIYMEDDIEVAPGFLDYIHKGLERFGDDNDFYAMCGYSLDTTLPITSSFYRQNINFSAWGYGMLTKTHKAFLKKLTRWYSVRKLLNPFTLFKVIHLSWGAFLFLCMHALRPSLDVDNVVSNYLLLEEKDVIMPRKSLVRNNGFDGSGEHCVANSSFVAEELDNHLNFEFIGDGKENRKQVIARLRQARRRLLGFRKMCSHIKSMLVVRMCRLFNERQV